MLLAVIVIVLALRYVVMWIEVSESQC